MTDTEFHPAESPAVQDVFQSQSGKAPPTGVWAWLSLLALLLVMLASQADWSAVLVLEGEIRSGIDARDSSLVLWGTPAALIAVFYGLFLARFSDLAWRNVMAAAGLAVAGVFVGLAALVRSTWSMFFLRAVSLAGHSVVLPAILAVVADRFRREHLPRAIAIVLVGGSIASVAIYPLVSWAGHSFGWRTALVIVALATTPMAGLALLAGWAPRKAVADSHADGRMSLAQATRGLSANWLVYLLLMVSAAVSAAVRFDTSGLSVRILASMLERTHQPISAFLKQVLPVSYAVEGLVGLALGAAVAEWLGRRGRGGFVLATAIFYSLFVPFAALAPFMPGPMAEIVCGSLGSMCLTAATVSLYSALLSVTPSGMRCAVIAFLMLLVSLAESTLGQLGTTIAFEGIRLGLNEGAMQAAGVLIVGSSAALVMWLGVGPFGQAIGRIDAAPASDQRAAATPRQQVWRLGRISRLGFLVRWLSLNALSAIVATAVVLGAILLNAESGDGADPATALIFPMLAIPILASQAIFAVQRCHDIGWSGWAALATFVPVISLVVVVMLMLVPGQDDPNRFGPNPLNRPPPRPA